MNKRIKKEIVEREIYKNKSTLQICVENNNNKTTDLMLVQSPYFFVLCLHGARAC